MNMWELCKCNDAQFCPFCKLLTVVGLIVLSIVLGYMIGRRRKAKK